MPHVLAESEIVDGSSHRTQPRARVSPIVWLNFVCLDAPIVAVIWQWFFARSFRLPVTTSARCALFLTAWLIYLADRFADSSLLRKADLQSLRQQFCWRHSRGWMAALGGVALLDVWVILRLLDRSLFLTGLVIGLLAFAYLATNYWLGRIWRRLPVKEICVGFLFALGTIAALIPEIQFSSVQFVASFLLFGVLCSLNCISIAVWERALDQAQHKNSIATRWPKVQRHLKIGAVVFATCCLTTAILVSDLGQLFTLIGVCALLLAVLDLVRSVIPCDERTALADIVLLTPLLLLFSRSA